MSFMTKGSSKSRKESLFVSNGEEAPTKLRDEGGIFTSDSLLVLRILNILDLKVDMLRK